MSCKYIFDFELKKRGKTIDSCVIKMWKCTVWGKPLKSYPFESSLTIERTLCKWLVKTEGGNSMGQTKRRSFSFIWALRYCCQLFIVKRNSEEYIMTKFIVVSVSIRVPHSCNNQIQIWYTVFGYNTNVYFKIHIQNRILQTIKSLNIHLCLNIIILKVCDTFKRLYILY